MQVAMLFFAPPAGYYPSRHSLGAVLLQQGKADEAEVVYREDLKRFPENGWALFGLMQSLRAQGKNADAAGGAAAPRGAVEGGAGKPSSSGFLFFFEGGSRAGARAARLFPPTPPPTGTGAGRPAG